MNRIATLALAAIFTSMMAHGQDVPDRLCGYIEFPFRYSEAQGHYYRVTPQLAKRGRPYGSLDVTQAQSIVQASSADLNGNSQVVVSYRDGSQFTLTPMPCGSEAPPNDGYVCATVTQTYPGDAIEYDRHGMAFDHAEYERLRDAGNWHFFDAGRAECLDYVRADYPNADSRYIGFHVWEGNGYCWFTGNTVWGASIEPQPPAESVTGLHNLARYQFQGTLQGGRVGLGAGFDVYHRITHYETQDNCPALPANGD